MLLQNMNNQENQKKHNGNRRYSILLLALLFIGMATYGTYAYFTDSTSVSGNIELKTGTVKFSEVQVGEWTSQRTNDKGVAFSNVQPGDVFTKTATVEYTGSLDGFVTVNQFTKEEFKKGLDYKILVDGKEIDPEKKIPVGKDKKTFTVSLEVTIPLLEEEYTEERQNMVFNLNELADAVTFSVEQTGLPE